MNLHTSLSGRLRNTRLPKTKALFPLFEAVVNSIHSIDERILFQKNFSIEQAKIEIKILRSKQTRLDDRKSEIIGFEVIDNGVGFNQANYESFQTLDSEYKINRGCRGIGRLLWLKAFSTVEVESIFYEGDAFYRRRFKFDASSEISNEKKEPLSEEESLWTKIILTGLEKNYADSIPKTSLKIGEGLLEHCLWYFLRDGGVPSIVVSDEGEPPVCICDLYDSCMFGDLTSDEIKVKGQRFDIVHAKLKGNFSEQNLLSFAAADRLVKSETLVGKVPGLFGKLNDQGAKFSYMGFVSSPYLTEHVAPERMAFDIPEKIENGLDPNEISFEEIQDAVLQSTKNFLAPYLVVNREQGKKRIIDFVTKRAPRYRPIIKRISDDDKIVNPEISDRDLDLKLHTFLSEIEAELIREGHDLMLPVNMENEDEYASRLSSYLSKATDLKQSDLANYVAHRRVVIDLFEKALRPLPNGKYVKEDVIHTLIMPMQKDSMEISSMDSNLWLIDERLAFHSFLASDKTIRSMPITDSDSTKEPDLLSLNVYDNPVLVNDSHASKPLATINVVEIKRPMRNDVRFETESNPIQQALNYLSKIRDGKVRTVDGRPIPQSKSIPGFCYVLCDLTPAMEEVCSMFDLMRTSDCMGYFGFHKNLNSYIEVISFDRLIQMAKERNRAFFDKLGIPAN